VENTMRAEDFIERDSDKGPGVAAVVVLSALIERLSALGHLYPNDLNLIFDAAEIQVAGDNRALIEARKIITKMKASAG
jgi:hypothetical protein